MLSCQIIFRFRILNVFLEQIIRRPRQIISSWLRKCPIDLAIALFRIRCPLERKKNKHCLRHNIQKRRRFCWVNYCMPYISMINLNCWSLPTLYFSYHNFSLKFIDMNLRAGRRKRNAFGQGSVRGFFVCFEEYCWCFFLRYIFNFRFEKLFAKTFFKMFKKF